VIERQAARRMLTLLSSAVIDQAMLSGANFVVGLLLIRYVTDVQYGYYVLAFNAIMLMTTLQGAFITTPLLIRISNSDEAEQRRWVGGLMRDQQWWSRLGSVIAIGATALAWFSGKLDAEAGLVMLAAAIAIPASLYREYLRGVLLIYKRPGTVLGADAVYCVGLTAGAILAAQFAIAATVALLVAGASALVCAHLLRKAIGPGRGFDPLEPRGRLAQIASLGAWSAAGGVIHWAFSQGYSFLAAATLDVTAVAALAAARLLMMPVNLLSSGVQRQLMPIASGWLQAHGASKTLKRLLGFSLALGTVAICYSVFIWVVRDWIFVDLMRKDFAHRDRLVALWSLIFLTTVVRDPIMYIAVLRERFRILSVLTLACAVTALSISYVGMLHIGETGALVGILAGELLNLAGVIALTWHELRRTDVPPPRHEPNVVTS